MARRADSESEALSLYLDVQNVYHRRVVEPIVTGFRETLPSYGFGLPILPIFGIEGELWPRVTQEAARPARGIR